MRVVGVRGALGHRASTSLSLCTQQDLPWAEFPSLPPFPARLDVSARSPAALTQSRFGCQGKCQTGRQADTHRPPPKELGIWVPQLPNLRGERPRQSAPAMEQSEEEEAAKGMWCTISAAIKGESPCQLVAALPAPAKSANNI